MMEDGGTDRGDCCSAKLSKSGSLEDNNVKSNIKNHSTDTVCLLSGIALSLSLAIYIGISACGSASF